MKQQHYTKLIKPDFPKLFDRKIRNQNIGTFFSSMSPWALFALVVVCCVLIVGGGAWIGYTKFNQGVRLPDSPISTAVGAILGLLAFMLGFTFSLTWSRFSNRNSLVIAHAKAIWVCFLRTNLIPEKQKSEMRKLLREYTYLLLGLQAITEPEKSLRRIDELQLMMWQQTVSLLQEDMDSEVRGLFIISVNEIISLSLERKIISLVFRIPDPIWASLLLLAVMGTFAFGYQSGINGVLRIFEMPLLPIAFGLVIVLIADLNSSGGQRRFKVTQKPLNDILEMMKKDMP